MTNTNPTITQTTIYKTLHRKLKIDQHKPNYHSSNHLQTLHRKQKIDQHEPNYHSNNHLQNISLSDSWVCVGQSLGTQLSLKQPSTKHYTENKRLTNTNHRITQTTIYKTLHRKLKIDQHEPNYHSNNHLQNITQKTKDWPTRTQLTQTTIYKTLHRKLKIDQHEPNYHSNNHLQNIT